MPFSDFTLGCCRLGCVGTGCGWLGVAVGDGGFLVCRVEFGGWADMVSNFVLCGASVIGGLDTVLGYQMVPFSLWLIEQWKYW